MNEVSFTKAQVMINAGAAASKGAVIAAASDSGKKLPGVVENQPVSDVQSKPEAKAEPAVNLEIAVASVNSYVQSIQRDLQFTVDEELERTVIKVVDSGSGELIRQIPEDIFLELARNLKQDGEFQLVNALG